MADLTSSLRDAAYVAVGFGVLGVNRAQVRRRELNRELGNRLGQAGRVLGALPGVVGAAPGVVGRLAGGVERTVERTVGRVVERVPPVVPGAARDVIRQTAGWCTGRGAAQADPSGD